MANRILVGLLVICVGSLMIAGCASKVSKSSMDQIKSGMTLADVEKIMGKGIEENSAAGAIAGLAGSAKVMTWKDGEKAITVTFLNDKVTTVTSKGL